MNINFGGFGVPYFHTSEMEGQFSFLALIIFCAAFCSLQAAHTRNSSPGEGPARQTCGTNNLNFYCPLNGMCEPRNQRCTGTSICIDETGEEEGCFESSIPDKYYIQLGHSELGFSGSKQYRLEHQFIAYRGLTYEFGNSYGVQILDTIDPEYKYRNGEYLFDTAGSSYCTWEDATQFSSKWDTNYGLLTNNCQHFTIMMQIFLLNSTCNKPPSSRRQDDIGDYIDQLLSHYSVLQCYNNNSAFPTVTASMLTTILIIGIAFLLQI